MFQLNTLVGCEFIATNLDATAHLTKAQAWAGAGTMVSKTVPFRRASTALIALS